MKFYEFEIRVILAIVEHYPQNCVMDALRVAQRDVRELSPQQIADKYGPMIGIKKLKSEEMEECQVTSEMNYGSDELRELE